MFTRIAKQTGFWRRLTSVICAAALMLSTVQIASFAGGQKTQAEDEPAATAYLVYVDGTGAVDYTGQNSAYAERVVITGSGTYDVSLDVSPFAGTLGQGVSQFRLEVEDGAELFPFYRIAVWNIEVNGLRLALAEKGYTADVDGNTVFNFYNKDWKNDQKYGSDRRSYDDDMSGAVPNAMPDAGFDLIDVELITVKFSFVAPDSSADVAHLIVSPNWNSCSDPFITYADREKTVAYVTGNGEYTVKTEFYTAPTAAIEILTLALQNGSKTFNGCTMIIKSVIFDGVEVPYDNPTNKTVDEAWGDDIPNMRRAYIYGSHNDKFLIPGDGTNGIPADYYKQISTVSGNNGISLQFKTPVKSFEATFEMVALERGPAANAGLYFMDSTFEYSYTGPADDGNGIDADYDIITKPGQYTASLDFTGLSEGAVQGINTLGVQVLNAESDSYYKGYTIEIVKLTVNAEVIINTEYSGTGLEPLVANPLRGYTYPDEKDIKYDIYDKTASDTPHTYARTTELTVNGDYKLGGTTRRTIPVYDSEGNLNDAFKDIENISVTFQFCLGVYQDPKEYEPDYSGTYDAYITFQTSPNYTHRNPWTSTNDGKYVNGNLDGELNPDYGKAIGYDPQVGVPKADEVAALQFELGGAASDLSGLSYESSQNTVSMELGFKGLGLKADGFGYSEKEDDGVFLESKYTGQKFLMLGVSTSMDSELWDMDYITGVSFTVSWGAFTRTITDKYLIYGEDDGNGYLVLYVINSYNLSTDGIGSSYPAPAANQTISITFSLEFAGLEPGGGEGETVNKTALQTRYDILKNKVRGSYTKESWDNFTAALSDAKAVLDNGEATQQQVNNALAALNDAYDLLEKPAGCSGCDNTASAGILLSAAIVVFFRKRLLA